MKISPQKKFQLQQKGWSDQEVHHAQAVLERSEKSDVFFSRMVFWTALMVILLGNFMASLLLIPFLVVFNAAIVYTLAIFLGGAIGFLYNFLINDVEHLEAKHHLLATIIIPLIAIINIFLVVAVSNQLISESNLKNDVHSPLITALIFAIALLLPYTIDRVHQYLQNTPKAAIVR